MMDRNNFYKDDFEKYLSVEYKSVPNVEMGPSEDSEDAGYKMVYILANDLALDSTELDLDGLN